MRKSILTVITLALVLINLVLTVITSISILPEVRQVNSLITQIASAIDLDVQSASGASGGAGISMDQLEPYLIPADGSNMTVNLKDSGDGKDHYASMTVTLSLNTNSEKYETLKAALDNGDWTGVIMSDIKSVVSQYTVEEMRADQEGVQEAIRTKLKGRFGDDFIAGVSINPTYQ